MRKTTIKAIFAVLALASPAWAETVSITAVGDIMMGTAYPTNRTLPPEDGMGLFDSVRHLFSDTDILIGNLEGAIADSGNTKKCEGKTEKTCYVFLTPSSYTAHLREAGFDALNLANNHSGDFGPEGIRSTVGVLEEYGITPYGGRRLAEFSVNGRKAVIAGFSVFKSPYSYPMDTDTAVPIISRLAGESDILIVTFHAGAEGSSALHVRPGEEEFLGEKRGDVTAFAHTAIDSGADIVIGHGPHVLRALEIYKGKLIAYSLGNFLTYERFNVSGPNGLSAVLRVELDAETGDFVRGRLYPIALDEHGVPEPDPAAESVKLVRKLSAEDFPSQHAPLGETGGLGLDMQSGLENTAVK